MKLQFDTEDIQAIAKAVAEEIKPLLLKRPSHESDVILTPEQLAKYLQVDVGWVYKAVNSKAIPFIKAGKYLRFKKSAIDRWIEEQTTKPVTDIKNFLRRLDK